jgi:hypothetical protein
MFLFRLLMKAIPINPPIKPKIKEVNDVAIKK